MAVAAVAKWLNCREVEIRVNEWSDCLTRQKNDHSTDGGGC